MSALAPVVHSRLIVFTVWEIGHSKLRNRPSNRRLKSAVAEQLAAEKLRERHGVDLGELVQIDGCDHRWFEDRAPACTALVYVDDATSRLSDKHAVFRVNGVARGIALCARRPWRRWPQYRLARRSRSFAVPIVYCG